MLQNLNDATLLNSLKEIAKKRSTQFINVGENYFPVTGKVLDEEDILMGVNAALDRWFTVGSLAGIERNPLRLYWIGDLGIFKLLI